VTPSPRPFQGFSIDEQRVAWFRQVLVAMVKGDARLLAVAQEELRRLGIEVAPVPGTERAR